MVVRQCMNQEGKLGVLFVAMALRCMGYQQAAYPLIPFDTEDIPWCGRKLKEKVAQQIPLVIRALPLVKWYEQYQYYNQMINALSGSIDYLFLEKEEYKKRRKQQFQNFFKIFFRH
jgi:hypothetical protein